MRNTITTGLALMLAVNIPATFGLLALSHEIIRLLLERGHFTPADTVATATALRLYAVGLVGYSTTRIASPVFYTLGKSRVPVALSVTSVTVNLILSVILVRAMGFSGLALATSIAALVNGTLCIALLRAQLDGIGGRTLIVALSKVAAASAAMSAVVITVNRLLYEFTSDGGTLQQLVALAATIGAGLIALAIAARLLRINEFEMLTAEARRRVQKLLAR